jgi:hypothetical protein
MTEILSAEENSNELITTTGPNEFGETNLPELQGALAMMNPGRNKDVVGGDVVIGPVPPGEQQPDQSKQAGGKVRPQDIHTSLGADEKQLNSALDNLEALVSDKPLADRLQARNLSVVDSKQYDRMVRDWNETDKALNAVAPNAPLSELNPKADDRLKAFGSSLQFLQDTVASMEKEMKEGGQLAGVVDMGKLKQLKESIKTAGGTLGDTGQLLHAARLEDAIASFSDGRSQFRRADDRKAIRDLIEKAPDGRAALEALRAGVKDRYDIKIGDPQDSRVQLIIHDKAFNRDLPVPILVDKKALEPEPKAR